MRFLAVGHVNILTKKQKQICNIVPQSRAPSGLAVVLGPQRVDFVGLFFYSQRTENRYGLFFEIMPIDTVPQ